MSKKAKATCNDCYFRCAALCALPGEEVCPTFRLQATVDLMPPQQPTARRSAARRRSAA